MTYRYTHGIERWKIDAVSCDRLIRWQLFHAVEDAWKELRVFPNPEEAMSAVSTGNTGVPAWDRTRHDPAEHALHQWSLERW